MPRYDSALFDPPAPVARVIIRDPKTGQEIPGVPMLLDTGADITLLPLALIQRVGIHIEKNSTIRLAGFDGTRSDSAVIDAQIIFESFAFRGKFVITEGSIGIIGRDILNLVTIKLDGAQLTWDILAPNS